MPDAPQELETERLFLRRPVADDAHAIFARYASDPIVTRYVSWPTHASVDDTARFLRFADEAWGRMGIGPYLAFAREGGALLGSTGLDLGPEGVAATGYVLARDSWNQGYASEMIAAMIALASNVGIVRMIACCHVEHAASRRVLEKAGFALANVESEGRFFPNVGTDREGDVATYVRDFGPHAATSAPTS